MLRPGGRLLAGFMNPDYFLFDHDAIERGGALEVRYPLPYSDLTSRDAESLATHLATGRALKFGHSLEAQIGGQIDAGFVIAGLYEDRWMRDDLPLDRYTATAIATLSLR